MVVKMAHEKHDGGVFDHKNVTNSSLGEMNCVNNGVKAGSIASANSSLLFQPKATP